MTLIILLLMLPLLTVLLLWRLYPAPDRLIDDQTDTDDDQL